MTTLRNISISIIAALAFSSCIRDDLDACPPLRVSIGVKDKNYSNVDMMHLDKDLGIDERVSEDQPLGFYVPTLYWRLSRLRDDGTRELIKERGVFAVEGEEKTLSLDFGNELPFGRYVFTVWGGMGDLDEFNADRTEVKFHPDNAQGYDVYLASDTLDYDASHGSFESMLRRTKGKLIIYAEDLPRRVEYSGKTVDGLYGRVDTRFDYSDSTAVKTAQNRRGADNILTETFLTPSTSDYSSLLDINFYDDNRLDHPDIEPRDIHITMSRNELTVLKYVYNQKDNTFYIYQRVNDTWETVHDMIVE